MNLYESLDLRDGITLIDVLRRNDGTTISLAAPPAYISGDAGEVGVMELGEVWTYRAEYILTQADIDAGGVSNSIVARRSRS